VLPGDHVGTEAVVGEAAGGVEQGVGGRLEVDEVGVGADRVGARLGGLVRVVEGGEAAEARLDLAVGGVQRDGEVGVEGALLAQLEVGLVQRVEQVGGDDEDVDAPAVLREALAARLGLRVAGADGDAVVDGLYPPRYQLRVEGRESATTGTRN